jgi:hypothetical protein
MNAEKEARVKSWVLMAGGMAGIGYQQYIGKTDLVLLLIFIALIGVPGYTEILSILRGSQSSLSQPVDSELDSPSSSSDSSRE